MTNDRVTLRRLINAPSYAALWSYSLARTQPLVWRFLNRSGRAMLERHRPSLDGYQQALVDGLSTDGVAVTHFDDLFSDQQELAGLVTLVERLKRKLRFLTQMCARFSPSRSAAPWEEGADALVPANQR